MKKIKLFLFSLISKIIIIALHINFFLVKHILQFLIKLSYTNVPLVAILEKCFDKTLPAKVSLFDANDEKDILQFTKKAREIARSKDNSIDITDQVNQFVKEQSDPLTVLSKLIEKLENLKDK